MLPSTHAIAKIARKGGWGGGVMVRIKLTYPSVEVELKDIDGATVTLQNQKTLYIGSFYRPTGSMIDQLEALDATLYQIAGKLKKNSTNSTIILGGNFNAGHNDWETNSIKAIADHVTMHDKLITLLNNHHLTQLQKEPTRV